MYNIIFYLKNYYLHFSRVKLIIIIGNRWSQGLADGMGQHLYAIINNPNKIIVASSYIGRVLRTRVHCDRHTNHCIHVIDIFITVIYIFHISNSIRPGVLLFS